MLGLLSAALNVLAATATSGLYWLAAENPNYAWSNTFLGGSPYLGLLIMSLKLGRDRGASVAVLTGTLVHAGLSLSILSSYLRPFIIARRTGSEVMNCMFPAELALPVGQWIFVAILLVIALLARAERTAGLRTPTFG
jgi:hypothetical protein